MLFCFHIKQFCAAQCRLLKLFMELKSANPYEMQKRASLS